MDSPYVEIVEQPSSGVRFRYQCEGRSAGCIRGVNSSEKLKTYPTIQVHKYQGAAGCIVSCITKDGPPFYPHPYNLVGKHSSGSGICYKAINVPDMICSFSNLGIQCVKRKDIAESLQQREQVQVDPFGTGFPHSTQLDKMNLNTVRLCFQVFIADSCGKLTIPLPPVISDPIFDSKAVSDLSIAKLSHQSSPVIGGQQIILLCNQVNGDDIEVVFFEEIDNEVVWLSVGQFMPNHVHRKAAILFFPPAYRNLNIADNVKVFIQLRRPSDGACGKPEMFTYVPLKYDPDGLLRKKHKFEAIKSEDWFLFLANDDQECTSRSIKKAVRKKNKNNVMDINQGTMMKSLLPHYEYRDQNDPSTGNLSSEKTSMDHPSELQNNSNGCDHISLINSNDLLQNLDLKFDSSCLDANMNDVNFDSFPDVSLLNVVAPAIDINSSSTSEGQAV